MSKLFVKKDKPIAKEEEIQQIVKVPPPSEQVSLILKSEKVKSIVIPPPIATEGTNKSLYHLSP